MNTNLNNITPNLNSNLNNMIPNLNVNQNINNLNTSMKNNINNDLNTNFNQNFIPINSINPTINEFSNMNPISDINDIYPYQNLNRVNRNIIAKQTMINKQEIDERIDKNKKPKMIKDEKKKTTRKRKVKDEKINTQTNQTIQITPNEIENNIQVAIENNKYILTQLEYIVDKKEFSSFDRNWILNFCHNINLLLCMTDDIAKPARLPFLSLTLDVPPELVDAQRFNSSNYQ